MMVVNKKKKKLSVNHFHANNESIKFKLARWLVLHFGRFCQIDSGNIHAKLRRRLEEWLNKGIKSNPSIGETKLWPQLVMLVFIYTSAKFCALTYYIAEEYHYEKMLDKQRTRFNGTDLWSTMSNSSSSSEYLSQQQLGLLHAIEMQQFLGAPYRRGGICVACAYHILMNLTFLSYIVTLFYDNYIVNFRSHLIDSLLVVDKELANCLQIIHTELEHFRGSSANIIVQVSEQVEQMLGSECEMTKTILTSEAIEEHARLIVYLNELIVADRLMPINRSAEWLQEAINGLVQVNVGNIIYSLLIDIFLAFGVPHLAGIELYTEQADILSLIEMFALAEINVITTGFYMALQLAHLKDQSKYLDYVIGELDDCIRSNEREFARVFESQKNYDDASMGPTKQRMNRNLIEVLLKYRIFIRQLRQNQNSWHICVFISLDLMFFIPLILNLFSPYAKLNSVRSLGILFSMSVVAYADSLLLPMCKFHTKGQQLYRSLWSLLAHTIQVERRAGEPTNNNLRDNNKIYSNISVRMLRLELAHPQDVLDQFEVDSLGFSATFASIIELHFYYGVVLMSLFFEVDSWRKLLGDRLTDPLNLT